MGRSFLIRLCYAILSLALVVITIFLFIRVTGDPAALLAGPDATPQDVEALRKKYNLDAPLLIQLGQYIINVAQLNLGESLFFNMPVSELIARRLPATLALYGSTFIFSLVVGVSIGIMAALYPNGAFDRFGRSIALFGVAIPSFWLGLILIMVFALYLRWLPVGGSGKLTNLVLPTIALSGYFIASNLRITRSAMLEALNSEYVRFAYTKGISKRRVVLVHALRNSLIPIITLVGINLTLFMNASVGVELVFNWPGVGQLLFEGIQNRDFPIVQGVVLFMGAFVIFANFIVDVLYMLIDPRVRINDK